MNDKKKRQPSKTTLKVRAFARAQKLRDTLDARGEKEMRRRETHDSMMDELRDNLVAAERELAELNGDPYPSEPGA